MVDSINGAGGPRNITPTSISANIKKTKETSEGASFEAALDEVQVSGEAQELADAEKTARDTRALLEEDTKVVLSSDTAKIEKLA